ncbi:MAG: PhzF family phenazine biosynthesis protein, partial [Proteobacteria bacterium]|nr:PhzF family phenazine biosynthesis protein [Pseudomonadota bacterium]
MTGYCVYDVFTDTPFGGNQLAVIPDATGLNEADLQRITTEFNFSEVTFVYPPKDAANTAYVRIFTRAGEIPFAGHPTIGTAIALSDLGAADDMMLELGIGPIPCTITKGTPKSATFTTTTPLERFNTIPADLVAKCLSLPQDAIVTKNHAPENASVGRSFVMIELAGLDMLAQANPITDAYQNACKMHGGPEGRFSTYVYTKTPNGVQARMFSPLTNTPEDPATGSAAAALGAYLTAVYNQAQTL